MATCPECSVAVVTGDSPRMSEIIECSGCHAELEITTLDPIALEVAPEIEEDWGE